MVRKKKTTLAKFFSLLVAVTLCLTVFTAPVSAENGDENPVQNNEKTKTIFLDQIDPEQAEPAVVEPVYENGRWMRVHSIPATFEKNYILSPEQKEYAITSYENVIADILKPDMSDLEKYYTLALWLNKYVEYDWDFWPAGYDFDYYSHQWDAIGILTERKSVCAGIAVAYANLCHAADLPCKFIRMKPLYLDHTINYIPDINGHAYYIDVTENMMFMSDVACTWDPMDLDFSHIPESRIPDDGSFEYYDENNCFPSPIKDYYDTPFDEWFTEYALHQNTDKAFRTEYVEKGSGTRGIHFASYKDYPKQSSDTEKPGLWFLEDFYKDPKTINSKILNKELDGQLLNISGIQGSYDCNTAEELITAVRGDIAIRYFPSSENNQVVARAVDLTNNTDYSVSCGAFDPSTGEATITITGTGEYHGEYQIPVRVNSAAVTNAPVNHMDLAYAGKPQALVEPGTAINGTILYAVRKKGDAEDAWKKGEPDAAPYPEPADLLYTEEIPTATDVGRYDVWYKVEGEGTHFDIPPQHVERVAVISPLKPKIIAKNRTLKVGEEIKLTPKLDPKKAVAYDYLNLNRKIIKVSKSGIVKGVAAGTAKVTISGTLKKNNPKYSDPDDIDISITVNKGVNPMKLTAKTVKIKSGDLRKKAQEIKRAKLITVSKAQGKLEYTFVSAKKGKKSFNKYFMVNSNNGNVTVNKGLKNGKYLVKVRVKAAGNDNYEPSSWKSVTSIVNVN